MAFFPFMIQMDDKKCLIVGGGKVAARKAEQMLSFGAVVTLIAPVVSQGIYDYKCDRLHIIEREAVIDDIDGADVVIMATDDSGLNEHFAKECRDRRILVNVVDVKKDCDFYFPAIIKQGDVVISVSTGGSSPLLAAKIKKDIAADLRDDYGRIADEMGLLRDSIIERGASEKERKEIFMDILDKKINEKIIKLGTRGSALALVQTDMVIDRLKCKFPDYTFEKVILTTKGDKQKDVPVSAFGGKAVFVEEIENALADGTIDMAVHSAKDMPNPCRKGLNIAAVLPRARANDVLIYKSGLDKTGEFVVGTSSLRRQCQISMLYPDAICKNLRGNVGTRIDKLKSGEYDAIILAAAGIERLNACNDNELIYEYLDTDDILPAAGQGIIAVETRNTGRSKELACAISDTDTAFILEIERSVLTRLNAGCHEPIGVYAVLHGDKLAIELMNAREGEVCKKKVTGDKSEVDSLIDELCG